MSGNSKSLLSYPDIKEAFDRVIQGGKGVRLTFDDYKARDRWIFRAMSFRVLDRENNKTLYPDPAMTMHGRSVYDPLTVRKEKGTNNLTIEKIESTHYLIEDL